MRQIPLSKIGNVEPRAVIEAVVTQPGRRPGLTMGEVRARNRVLGALAASQGKDQMLLEDADHKTLCECLDGFPWGVAAPELETFFDSVLLAKATNPNE